MGTPACSLALYGQQEASVQLVWASMAATVLFKGKGAIIGWHWAKATLCSPLAASGPGGCPLCSMVVDGAPYGLYDGYTFEGITC